MSREQVEQIVVDCSPGGLLLFRVLHTGDLHPVAVSASAGGDRTTTCLVRLVVESGVRVGGIVHQILSSRKDGLIKEVQVLRLGWVPRGLPAPDDRHRRQRGLQKGNHALHACILNVCLDIEEHGQVLCFAFVGKRTVLNVGDTDAGLLKRFQSFDECPRAFGLNGELNARLTSSGVAALHGATTADVLVGELSGSIRGGHIPLSDRAT
mmetsp:Transcript_27835/g.32137  ORF Transcript_27835/g.32137 Transcript_27835/m.32137 type:complete len:209 (-) Transcript_27835:112-738(-)